MTLNEAIKIYLQQDAIAKEAARAAKAAREFILNTAGDRDTLTTDMYTVFITASESVRLDTKKLYADFTEEAIKRDYGRVTVSRSIDARPRTDADSKSA